MAFDFGNANEAQRSAISTTDGPLLIIAGPGTGKTYTLVKRIVCNGVQREHNKKLNNGLPILHKVPPKRDYGRNFCIMAEKGGTSHGA